MTTRRLLVLVAMATALSASLPVAAKPNLSKGPLYVAEAERVLADGRATQISLETPEIGATIELGRVAETSSSGSYNNYYWSAGPFNEAPALFQLAVREAEVKAAPLRKALQGFDGSSLAIAAARNGIASTQWLQPAPLEVLDQPRMSSPLDFVDAAHSGQVAMISTGYYLSPDCGQIEAKVEFRLIRKVKKSVSMVAFQTATSVVQLPKPSFDPNANVRAWSANNADLARRAITMATARLEKLIPRMLALTSADVTAWSAKGIPMVQAAGRFGPVVENAQDGPGSVTIWSKGLVAVQPLPVR